MKLLTNEQREQMLKNGRELYGEQNRDKFIDLTPVVKLSAQWNGATWLLAALHPDDPNFAYGLCDLGMPEIGFVYLSEIEERRGPGGLKVERDIHFEATKTLSEYSADARKAQRIVT